MATSTYAAVAWNVIGSSAKAVFAARIRAAAALGSLTAAQIQQLVSSSGDRVVTLFTRLSQSPVASQQLYTSANPNLCNQIQHVTGNTQLYVGRIPYDLFQRLLYDGKILEQTTQMGGV
ncbi:MAG: hypothetical protein R3E01_18695 [Pirellulaceae bacterium]